jgi:predicted small secreted protein
MKKSALAVGAMLAATFLAACETTGGERADSGGISVTRMHLGQQIAKGEIRVEPVDPGQASSLDFAQVSSRIERELMRLGWRVNPANARTEQVAIARFTQMGGGDTAISEMNVRIQRRSDATVAWEGRAQLQGRPPASPAERVAVVDRLTDAMFRDFPGESGRTIRVR